MKTAFVTNAQQAAINERCCATVFSPNFFAMISGGMTHELNF